MSTLLTLSRRELLKAGGALVVTFSFSNWRPEHVWAQTPIGKPLDKPIDPMEVDSFIAIHADGTATVYSGKVDVGTGLRIAVAQMAAEELGMPASRITVIDGDTGICPDQGGTGGSTGLTRGGAEIRQAAAGARQALLALGATRLNRSATELTIVDGEVRPQSGGTGVKLGELIGDRRLQVKVDPKAPLRPPAQYTQVGEPILRPDVPAKTSAKHPYVHDVKVPGMLHARVVRPSSVGATLMSVDESSLKGIPDARAVRVGNFLAVVAKGEWAAVKGATALKATWTEAQKLPGSDGLDRWAREGALDRDQSVVAKGDVRAALQGASKTMSASYFWPMQSHASLGPSCAVADVKADGTTTVWSASQGTHGLRGNLSRVFA